MYLTYLKLYYKIKFSNLSQMIYNLTKNRNRTDHNLNSIQQSYGRLNL